MSKRFPKRFDLQPHLDVLALSDSKGQLEGIVDIYASLTNHLMRSKDDSGYERISKKAKEFSDAIRGTRFDIWVHADPSIFRPEALPLSSLAGAMATIAEKRLIV